MIDELHVRNLALIDDATIRPAAGLTVITGETGSGKTALLAALKLLCGERADLSSIAQGSSQLEIQARFLADSLTGQDGEDRRGWRGQDSAPAAADVALEPAGQDDFRSDFARRLAVAGECVVTRMVGIDGRSRANIDGLMVSVGQLAQQVGATIDLCGQHEHQRLTKPANHRAILDSWAREQVSEPLAAYRAAFEKAQEAAARVDALRSAASSDASQVEQARFVVRSITEVEPLPGEYEDLSAKVAALENSWNVKESAWNAHEALAGDAGASSLLGRAAALLDSVALYDQALRSAAATVREAAALADDAARDVQATVDSLELDAARLGQMQERLASLQSLLRSYGPGVDDVLAARDAAQATIDAAEGYADALEALLADQAQAEEGLTQAARRLFQAHKQAAPELGREVTDRLASLQMEGARIECVVQPLPRDSFTANGPDRVEFLFSAGEGLDAAPLSRIASGGELSRVMLALKVVLGADDAVRTLWFDEVVGGVGGPGARSLADVLAALSRTHQVIVVTHLPQVAVLGDVHYVVEKSTEGRPRTSIQAVRGQARVAEIARMLSGDTGVVARAHAAKLLEEAGR